MRINIRRAFKSIKLPSVQTSTTNACPLPWCGAAPKNHQGSYFHPLRMELRKLVRTLPSVHDPSMSALPCGNIMDACVIPLGLAHYFEWGLKTSILETWCGQATGSLTWWWLMAFHMQIHLRHMHAWICGEKNNTTLQAKTPSTMLISRPIPAISLWETPRPAATWNGPTLVVSQKLKRETKYAVCLIDILQTDAVL